MNPLQARKQALVAQSEAYRQALRIEVAHLALYGAQLRHRLDQWREYKALLMLTPLAVSLLGSAFGRRAKPKRHKGWRRLLAGILVGWRLYRRYGPVLQQLIARQMQRQPRSPAPTQPAPAPVTPAPGTG